jgi:hypothetical protein
MIKVFKEHSSKTCILDDFGFYEARQKTIQEKKAKQLHFPKQARLTPVLHFFVRDFYVYSKLCVGMMNFLYLCLIITLKLDFFISCEQCS